jgi:hypothetical protein
VAQVEELEGRLVKAGWPVILVRALLPDQPWWVQPAVRDVVDGQFTGRAHFGDADTPKGTRFGLVVLLAKTKEDAHQLRAGMTLKDLPGDLPRSDEIIVARDDRPREPRTLTFSGHVWRVKVGRRVGPGPNDFADATENVWLDDKEHLHLAITKAGGQWQCAEVVADRSLGYGEYCWVVSGDLPALERRTVLGLFTYETTTREIDFELSRWNDAAKPNAQFVVQPYAAKDSTHRFDTGKAMALSVSLIWEPARVRGRCWEGENVTKAPLADWTYTGRFIPKPGKERARANLWLFEGRPPESGEKQEIVVRSFRFVPLDMRKDK